MVSLLTPLDSPSHSATPSLPLPPSSTLLPTPPPAPTSSPTVEIGTKLTTARGVEFDAGIWLSTQRAKLGKNKFSPPQRLTRMCLLLEGDGVKLRNWPTEAQVRDLGSQAAAYTAAKEATAAAAAAGAADDPDTHWNEQFDAVLASGQAKGDYNRKPANPIGLRHSLPLCPSFPL